MNPEFWDAVREQLWAALDEWKREDRSPKTLESLIRAARHIPVAETAALIANPEASDEELIDQLDDGEE